MTAVLSTAFWEISLVVLSLFVLSAVSLAAMLMFLKGTVLLWSKQPPAPSDKMEPPEKKET